MSCKIINVGVEYYNSYLILGNRNVLIDTVPQIHSDKLIENIKEYIDINNLDTLIINHTEADRSGAVSALLNLNNNIEIIASLAGLKNLEQQLNVDFKQTLAKSNMTYKVSDNISLKFIITHNINWPDSMMVYLVEDKLLFSCDAFANENSDKESYFHEKLYPVSEYVMNAMQQLKNFEISKIYPGSGEEIQDLSIIDKYINWCKSVKEKSKVAILYLSHSGNTKMLTDYANKAIENVCLIDVDSATDDYIYEMIYNSDGVIFATPTEYRNIPKRMREIVCGINQYKVSDTLFASIGSHGWSGEAPNLIYSMLKARHFNTFKSPFRVMFTPTDSDFSELDKYFNEFLNQLI